jgi:hypothetical protein
MQIDTSELGLDNPIVGGDLRTAMSCNASFGSSPQVGRF